jgi:hypothetical protein
MIFSRFPDSAPDPQHCTRGSVSLSDLSNRLEEQVALPKAGLEHVQAAAACPLLLLQLLRAAAGQVRAAAATGQAGAGSYQQATEI